jgi:hypothetical protein
MPDLDLSRPLHDLSPQAAASRRDLLLDLLAMRARGESLPPVPLAPRLIRERAPRPKRRPHEAHQRKTTQTHEDRLTKCRAAYVQAEAERKAGLRPPRLRRVRPSVSRAKFSLPLGWWITYRTRFGVEQTCRILAAVPAGDFPAIPEGCYVRQSPEVKTARVPRYILALPPVDSLAKPTVILPFAAEVEGCLIRVHPSPPEALIGRLITPLEPGTHIHFPGRWPPHPPRGRPGCLHSCWPRLSGGGRGSFFGPPFPPWRQYHPGHFHSGPIPHPGWGCPHASPRLPY